MEKAVTRSTLIRRPSHSLGDTFPRGEGKYLMFYVGLKTFWC